MFPHPIPGRPQLGAVHHCHFPTWIQSCVAALSQRGHPSINHRTCPSKPNLNDRLV